MEIVKYNDHYAKEVAKMWNLSQDAWGGGETLKTEESVIKEEAANGYLNLYLAIDNNEVVGYCSFSIYQGDDDTSYLPLLNVRPDYHGKKVGKLLVLKVLEDAIASKYNRFDLYTWSGNVKAMPLYKKCGFMWEKKAESVHLMNWLPYMLKTEALKDYFEVIDWYHDNKRVIDSNYDGVVTNEQTVFTYHFENDKEMLKVDFERASRGIKRIETSDYIISMNTPGHKLIYGQEYETTYSVVNKTGKPLEVEFEGVNDEFVKHSFSTHVSVSDQKSCVSTFKLDKPKLKFSDGTTAPSVITKLRINGKEAVFKIGVNAVAPIEFKLNIVENVHYVKNDYFAYLDLESNLNEDQDLTISFPKSNIAIEDASVFLKAKGKASVKLKYQVFDCGVYDEIIIYEVGQTAYEYRLQNIISGSNGAFFEEIEGSYYLVNNEHIVTFDKLYREVFLRSAGQDIGTGILTPKLGEPYSKEFGNIAPVDHVFRMEGLIACLDLVFESKDFQGVKLVSKIRLHPKGIMEHSYLVENVDYSEEKISLATGYWSNSQNAFFPYDGKILSSGREGVFGMGSLDGSKLDENWVFFKNKNCNSGICFDFDMPAITDWYIGGKFKIENFTKGSKHELSKTYTTIVNDGLEKFRKFALNNQDLKMKSYINQFEILVNNGNPIIFDSTEVEIKNNVKTEDGGTLTIDGHDYEVESINEFKTNISNYIRNGVNHFTFKSDKMCKTSSQVLLKSEGEITIRDIIDSDLHAKSICNGPIEIKASKEYYDSVYSLKWNEVELLESTFPTVGPKSWWDFWPGGILVEHHPIRSSIKSKERKEIDVVTIKDNFNDDWTGFKLSTIIENEEKFKDVVLSLYVLIRPGTDVVATFATQYNGHGKFFKNHNNALFVELCRDYEMKLHLNETDYLDLKNSCSSLEDQSVLTYQLGDQYVHFVNEDERLSNFDEVSIAGIVNGTNMTLPDNTLKKAKPTFMIMSKERYTNQQLSQFKNIKFEVE